MKVLLNRKQIGFIYDNVYHSMDFECIVKFGCIMHKFNKGQYAFFVDTEFVDDIVKLCIDENVADRLIFFSICHSLSKSKCVKVEAKKYCIQFNLVDKIKSIKSYRDLARNPGFCRNVQGFYPDSLLDSKNIVEGGYTLGPFSEQDAKAFAELITYPLSMSVFEYKNQLTVLKDYVK